MPFFNPPTGHALVNLRSPQNALNLLSVNGSRPNASLCVICIHAGTDACPHKGQASRIGLCGGYKLDERDVPATEQRYLDTIRNLAA